MDIFNNNKQNTASNMPIMELGEFESLLIQNQYSNSDSLDVTLQKYDYLRSLNAKSLSKQQSTKLHETMLIFVNSINLFNTKEEILDFIIKTIQYTRTSTINDAVNLVAGVGFKAVKVASLVSKVATMGMANEVIDKSQKLTQKALTTNNTELAKAWTQKIDAQIKFAKKEYGGIFGGDKEFLKRLDELRKQ